MVETYRSKVQRQLWYVLGFIAIACLFFYAVRDILTPFITGILVAYLMNPLVNKFEKKKINRGIGALLALIIFFGAVIAIFLLIVPILKAQVAQFSDRLPEYVTRMQLSLKPLEAYLTETFSLQKNGEQIQEFVSQKGSEVLRGLVHFLTGVVTGGVAVFNFISLVFITPVVAFYLLRDFNSFTKRLQRLVPRDMIGDVKAQSNEINRTLAGFLRGQALVCLILGTYFAIGLSLAGLEFGLVIGLLGGIFAFLPYVGSSLGLILAVGLGYVQYNGDLHSVLPIVLVYAAGQIVEGNFLAPYLVGERVGLHPVWIIFALLAGGAIAGVTGVIFAVPVAAVIGVLVRYAISRYQDSEFYLAHQKAGARKKK